MRPVSTSNIDAIHSDSITEGFIQNRLPPASELQDDRLESEQQLLDQIMGVEGDGNEDDDDDGDDDDNDDDDDDDDDNDDEGAGGSDGGKQQRRECVALCVPMS